MIEKFHKSVIRLAKTFAASFKKRPDRLSKPAALDALVFLKYLRWCFQRQFKIKRIGLNNDFVMLKDNIQSKLIWGFRKLFQKFFSRVRIIIFESI